MWTSRLIPVVVRPLKRRLSVLTSPEANAAVEELKRKDPRTGERRIGNNFNYQMELGSLAARLGYTIDTIPSLPLALIHRSALPSLKAEESSSHHNSRLSALGLVTIVQSIHHYLYRTYPNLEGYMIWDITNNFTRWSNLKDLGESLGITDLIVTKHNTDEQMVAKAFTAVVGSVYIDLGHDVAEKLIHQFIIAQLKDTNVLDLIKIEHPKMMLRSILKSLKKAPPTARILKETGRLSHFPTFVVGIYSGTEFLGEGAGTSLQRAQNEAAVGILRKHFMSELKEAPLPTDFKDYKSEMKSAFRFEKDKEKNNN